MRINDVKLTFPIVDRDVEQCAIIKIIAVVEVGEIVSARPAVAPYQIALQSQSFWNQEAIEQIEKPLHKQR